jgi:hypothetical protein
MPRNNNRARSRSASRTRRASTPGKRNSSRKKRVQVRQPKPVQRMPRYNIVNRVAPMVQGQASPQALAILMKALMDPANCDPIRMPINRSSTETALAASHLLVDLDFSQGSTDTTNLAGGTQFIAMFRNPLRTMIISYPNASTLAFSYASTAINGVVSTSVAAPLERNLVWQPAASTGTAGFSPHGSYLYPAYGGVAEQRQGFWIDASTNYNATVTFNVTWTSVGTSVASAIRTYQFLNNDWVQLYETSIVPAVGTVPATRTITSQGYYAFSYASSNSGVDSISAITVSWTSSGPSYGHISAPGLISNASSIDCCRINAASMLLTNTTSELNKAGTMGIRNCPKLSNWQDDLTLSAIRTLSHTVLSPFERGAYAFLKPWDREDFNFVKFDASSSINYSTFPILAESSFTVMITQVPLTASLTYAGGQMQFQYNAHLEFASSNTWFPLGICPVGGLAEMQLMDLIANETNLFENPLHIAAILSFLRKVAQGVGAVAGGVAKYAPAVSRGISDIGKVAGHISDYLGAV